jgi:hypothetical protein
MIPPEMALVAGVALSCLMFAVCRGPTALIWSFLIGYLVLPVGAAVDFPGIPAVDKNSAIWLGATLGTLLFQSGTLRGLTFHPADLLAPTILLSTVYTSVTNGLGSWDGVSMAMRSALTLILPYGLARVHLRRPADLLNLGTALFWGGLVCVPLAVWEFRMSPQIHTTLYGYFPHSFAQQIRWGHFRPVLCMGHGLAVASYFGSCLLIGVILLKRHILRISLSRYAGAAVAAVGLGLAVTMSVGPWCAAICGWGLYWLSRRWRWAPLIAGAPGIVWLLVVFAADANWEWMTSPFEALGAQERAASLKYRLDAMSEYSQIICQQPWWGYGAWGRGRIANVATDSEALIYLLEFGLIGAGARYLWIFWMVLAAVQASERATQPPERELLLLFACLMGIGITASILGTAAVFVPGPLIGGACTGLAVTGTVAGRRRRAWRPVPLTRKPPAPVDRRGLRPPGAATSTGRIT